jgi:hypothetical protein
VRVVPPFRGDECLEVIAETGGIGFGLKRGAVGFERRVDRAERAFKIGKFPLQPALFVAIRVCSCFVAELQQFLPTACVIENHGIGPRSRVVVSFLPTAAHEFDGFVIAAHPYQGVARLVASPSFRGSASSPRLSNAITASRPRRYARRCRRRTTPLSCPAPVSTAVRANLGVVRDCRDRTESCSSANRWSYR